MYLSFEGPQAVVPLEERGKLFEDLTTSAGHRLVAALEQHCARPLPAAVRKPRTCARCVASPPSAVPVGGRSPSHPRTRRRSTESTEDV